MVLPATSLSPTEKNLRSGEAEENVRYFFVAAGLLVPFAVSTGAAAQCAEANVIVSVKEPEIDLYSDDAERKPMSLKREDFPPCTPIEQGNELFLFRIKYQGKYYWVRKRDVEASVGSARPCAPQLDTSEEQSVMAGSYGLVDDKKKKKKTAQSCPPDSAPKARS
ncbi:MAG TPA: hypothetical protein VIM02_05345 [Rhizomicrobium sp.]|jgi:hypothetical protein